LTGVETKIADLQVIAATLREALEVGCSDLMTCAQSAHCPLPFAQLADGRTSAG
jgi:MerR family mercuric resistance operon transcriptional regulator